MKTKLLSAFLAFAFLLSFSTPVAAEDNGATMIADVIIARPLCLAATAVGSVFFVLSLPVSLPTKSVNRSAHALVVTPYKATFTRPLGDFDSMKE